MPLDELRQIAAAVAPRRGWDFSQVRDDRDPVPWDYREVARRYLTPADRVLDIGTGGGEQFLALSGAFGEGVGIDPNPAMIATAMENIPGGGGSNVSFTVGSAEAAPFPDASFDVVLNRHATLDADEIMRVLRPGGYFVTQQVGAQNTFNFTSLFGASVGGRLHQREQEVPAVAARLQVLGGAIIAYGTYNVPYYFVDVESLVFWLMALPFPEDFAIETHWQQVDYLLAEYGTPRGIETNEHRELLVIRKAGG